MTYKLRDLESLHAQVLLTGQYTIGRESTNDFIVDGETLSRHHAWIHNDENAVWVMDAGSTNGTRVGEKACTNTEWTLVEPGDVIMFGSSGYRMEHAIVGDPSLEGQLVPNPPEEQAETVEATEKQAEPVAETPAETGPLDEAAETVARPQPQPATNNGTPRARPRVVPKPSSRILAGIEARNGGANLVPPHAPTLSGKRPIARIELPASEPEPTIALPDVELEAAQREVDRLVERANFIAQSRRLDIQTGRAQEQANFRATIPPIRGRHAGHEDTNNIQAGSSKPALKPILPPVEQEERKMAAKVQTDRFDPNGLKAPKPKSTPLPDAPKGLDFDSVPIGGYAPKPAAVVEPGPPGPEAPAVRPKASPAAFKAPPRRNDAGTPQPSIGKRPALTAKPASAPIAVPAASKAPAPIAQPMVPPDGELKSGFTVAQLVLYVGIGSGIGVGIGMLMAMYLFGG